MPALASLDCWLYVFIGPRQVGKTFGTLKYLLDNNRQHIYMRRTREELELITDDPSLNPYLDMEKCGYHVELQKQGKGWVVGDYEEDEEGERKIVQRRGIGLPLSRIARIRGFSGQRYTDVIMDEFIPENIVVVRKAEGDAFRNALITIAGNRVMEGREPLRVWLLANSNDLFSPIMLAMGLVDKVEEMERANQDVSVQNGICICLPKSDGIIEQRLKDPMLKYMADDSNFGQMAFRNHFAYTDRKLVRLKSIKGWKPFLRTENFYIWTNNDAYYCCRIPHFAGPVYGSSEHEKKLCDMKYPEMILLYRLGHITFSDSVTLYRFRDYFKVDNK